MELYTKYTQKHGAFSLYAGHTWDQVYLFVEALKKCDPKLDPAKDADLVKLRAQIRDNLEKIKGFVGQNGIFTYTPDNHNGLPPNWLRTRGCSEWQVDAVQNKVERQVKVLPQS